MLDLKTILVPIDFSPRSLAAAEHAVAIGNRFSSTVVFLHVVPLLAYEYAAYESGVYTSTDWPSEAQVRGKLEKEIDAVVEKLGPRGPVEKVVVKGDPPTKIEEMVTEHKADLIVMPTHGYGTFRRFVLGSVTSKVLNDISCPILTGSHVAEIPFHSAKPYANVTCAIDLGDRSEPVLRWAADFAKAYDAKLSVIHAAPVLETHATEGQYFTAELRGRLIDEKKKEIGEIIARVGCDPEMYVDAEEVGYLVPAAVKQAEADLLIIGRSPKQGLLGRLRTHAYALVRESPCAVISV